MATEKDPAMESFLDSIGKQAGFKQTRQMADATNTCVCCAGPATEFKDELSKREYKISQLCQKCQDGLLLPIDEG